MNHRVLSLVFAGLVALVLGSATLVGAVPLVGGESGIPPAPGWPQWRSISDYSCKPEAAESIRKIQLIEKELNKHIEWLSRHRKFLEEQRRLPQYYFFVAANAIKKAYNERGANNLSRGFNSEAFFRKTVFLKNLGPKLDTQFGRWLTDEEAYRYLQSITGIPSSIAFKDFFDHDVSGAVWRHTSRLLNEFQAKMISPLQAESLSIMNSLTSAGLCHLKKSEGQLAVEGDCNQRLAKVKAESDVIQREAESLLEKLTRSSGAAAENIGKSIHAVFMKWNTLSDREGKNCPAVKDYIENARKSFVGKFRAVYTNTLRQSR